MYSIHSTWVQQVATPSQLSSDEDEYFVFMLVNAYILLVETLHEVRKQKIKEKELRIENIAPFGGSFIKCLIDPRPPMSLQVASCRTHQTAKKIRKIEDITRRQYEHIKRVKTFALLTQFAMPFGSQLQHQDPDALHSHPRMIGYRLPWFWYLSGQQQAINSYQEQQQPAAQAKSRKQQASDPIT
ncbi:hypothetical protein VPH35_084213 [Triticum aestivum]